MAFCPLPPRCNRLAPCMLQARADGLLVQTPLELGARAPTSQAFHWFLTQSLALPAPVGPGSLEQPDSPGRSAGPDGR